MSASTKRRLGRGEKRERTRVAARPGVRKEGRATARRSVAHRPTRPTSARVRIRLVAMHVRRLSGNRRGSSPREISAANDGLAAECLFSVPDRARAAAILTAVFLRDRSFAIGGLQTARAGFQSALRLLASARFAQDQNYFVRFTTKGETAASFGPRVMGRTVFAFSDTSTSKDVLNRRAREMLSSVDARDKLRSRVNGCN